jgi:hypothetical protein
MARRLVCASQPAASTNGFAGVDKGIVGIRSERQDNFRTAPGGSAAEHYSGCGRRGAGLARTALQDVHPGHLPFNFFVKWLVRDIVTAPQTGRVAVRPVRQQGGALIWQA